MWYTGKQNEEVQRQPYPKFIFTVLTLSLHLNGGGVNIAKQSWTKCGPIHHWLSSCLHYSYVLSSYQDYMKSGDKPTTG